MAASPLDNLSDTASSPPHRPSPCFPKSKRLLHKRDFDRIYKEGQGMTCHPLRIITQPNEHPDNRLGLAVPKRIIGGAVARNRIRRCLREAFRHLQWDCQTRYDVMIIVQANETLAPHDYQRLIFHGMTKLHQRWNKKNKSI